MNDSIKYSMFLRELLDNFIFHLGQDNAIRKRLNNDEVSNALRRRVFTEF
jgi:hypothetical protein